MRSMIWQVPYILCCLVGVLAIFHVQRLQAVRGCRWWLYNVLAAALLWEAIDAWKFGPPGFPASRWVLLPTLSVLLVWTAVTNRLKRPKG